MASSSVVAGAQFIDALKSGDIGELIRIGPIAYASWWTELVKANPLHVIVETLLVFFIIYLVFLKKRPSKSVLTEQDVEELIEEWKPEPLVPQMADAQKRVLKRNVIIKKYVNCNEIEVEGSQDVKLNLVTMDFLGLSSRKELGDSARATLDEYGCGSCGPRGFYGSSMPHIEIENAMAKFMGTEAAISYSDAASGQSSTIPAFAKRGDLVVVDEGIHEAVKVGVFLSRAKVLYFKHNDVTDLEKVLEKLRAEDKRTKRDVTLQRRFLVTEALFKNDGSISPLKEIIELKNKFKFRLVLDECLSFGVLGKTGRGLTEHCGVPVTEVDMIMVSLENGMGAVGGLCLGNIEVVDHQRLSGAGYCFSAAAPPFVSAVALRSLEILEAEPSLLTTLENNCATLHKLVSEITFLKVLSDKRSPILIATLSEKAKTDATKWVENKTERVVEVLSDVVDMCFEQGVFIAVAEHTATIRVVVRASLSKNQIQKGIEVLRRACASCAADLKTLKD